MTKETKNKILAAAEKVFQQKGYNGARMQEIADTADINKGLLHYYFKTKARLFEAIFAKAFDIMVSRMNRIFSSQKPLMEKFDAFIENYLNMLLKNPAIPRFVISELNRHPESFVERMLGRNQTPPVEKIFEQIRREVEAGNIRPINPRHLLIDIIGMCVFPFIGRPMIQGIMSMDNDDYDDLLRERKDHIMNVLNRTLKPTT